MKKVLVSGYYGHGNLGDEALLRAIATGLRRRLPDAELVVASADPRRTAELHGIRAIPRLSLRHWWSELREADLLISGGGSLFQDVTGPWNIPYYAGVMYLAYHRGVPVMVFAQGVGPVRGDTGRYLVRYAMERAAVITVRDEQSRQFLAELGVRSPAEVCADPVFSLQLPPAGARDGGGAGNNPVRIGVSLRRRGLTEGIAVRLAAGLDLLAQNQNVEFVFFPMDAAEDPEAAALVAGRMRHRSEVVRTALDLDEVVDLLQSTDFVLAMRLHALILAALMQRPMAGISYDPKVDAFLGQVGQKPFIALPAMPDPGTMARDLGKLVADRRHQASRLAQALPALRRRAERAFALAADLIDPRA